MPTQKTAAKNAQEGKIVSVNANALDGSSLETGSLTMRQMALLMIYCRAQGHTSKSYIETELRYSTAGSKMQNLMATQILNRFHSATRMDSCIPSRV
jgi:hypothetical protein